MEQINFQNNQRRRMSVQPDTLDYNDLTEGVVTRAYCSDIVQQKFWGLAFNPFNDCVIASSRMQDIVCEFSVQEKSVMHVRHFSLPPPARDAKAIWSRQTVAIECDDTYAATDEANKQILIFKPPNNDKTAFVIHRFGSGTLGGNDEGNFMYPCGLATDHKGVLFVTDRHRGRLQRLDVTSGKFTILTEKLEGPKYLCLRENLLAVAEYDGGHGSIIDIRSGTVVRHIHKAQKNARGVQFVGSNTVMITGQEAIQVWDLATGRLERIVKKGPFSGITTTEGSRIAVGDLKYNGLVIL